MRIHRKHECHRNNGRHVVYEQQINCGLANFLCEAKLVWKKNVHYDNLCKVVLCNEPKSYSSSWPLLATNGHSSRSFYDVFLTYCNQTFRLMFDTYFTIYMSDSSVNSLDSF